jgi:hypothetical protein
MASKKSRNVRRSIERTIRNKKFKLNKYEKLIFNIITNAIFKTVDAIQLYSLETSYSSAFFLTVIAEEELAKLVILPIAEELDELEELVNNRNSIYFRHSIKQKIFTSFGLQNRTHDEIENMKQGCLYIGVDKNLNATSTNIKPELVYLELKHTANLLAHSINIILKTPSLSKDLKRSVMWIFGNIFKACVDAKLPRLKKDIYDEASKEIVNYRKDQKKLSGRFLQELFTNPYALIDIFKALFQNDYKRHLADIKSMSFDEMVSYLGKYVSDS